MRNKLAVLGAGNMGLAITDGIIGSGIMKADDIILVRRNTDKLGSYKNIGCTVCDDLYWAASEADAVILAVKPQMMGELFPCISSVCEGKLVISIAAGIKIQTIENNLPGSFVVRAMPNTPLTVGEGVTELCRGQNVSDDDFDFAKSLFEGAGYAIPCREEEINALTALTSSAVAYFASVEKAMCIWAKNNGLSRFSDRDLLELVSKTAVGSATLMCEKNIYPDELIKSVASPNGTTERALKVFENKDLSGVFDEAMTACLKRAQELSETR